MRADFDRARELLHGGLAIAKEFGDTVTAVVAAEPAALIAVLEGDPARAERLLRTNFESFDRMGERAHLATTAAKLAQAVGAADAGRHAEVEALVLRSREAGADLDVSTRVIGDGAMARSLAARGELVLAERLARHAVDLARGTDLLSQHGDAWLDLAQVLRHGGQVEESAAAAGEALRLFRRKGNLPASARTIKYLADLGQSADNPAHAELDGH